MTLVNKCPFCVSFGERRSPQQWYDEVLHERGPFIVVPGLGPQTPGYLLIIPRHHVYSMAELLPNELRNLMSIVRDVRNLLSSTYGSTTIYEHGSVPAQPAGSSCIDHAHLHCFVSDIDLVAAISREHDLRSVRGLQDLVSVRGSPYLYIEGPTGDAALTTVATVPGQYVRQVLARELGTPLEWDYAAYPRYEALRFMLTELRPKLAALADAGERV